MAPRLALKLEMLGIDPTPLHRLALTLDHRDALDALLAIRRARGKLEAAGTPAAGGGGQQAEPATGGPGTEATPVRPCEPKTRTAAAEGGRAAGPKTPLEGWRDITDALEMKYGDRDRIKSLNQRLGGPIINRGKGKRPLVDKDALREWWDRLATQEQELANRREGARLSAESQYHFGRDGEAAPEVGGGVKHRRRDGQS
jgi:hypothetical protein